MWDHSDAPFWLLDSRAISTLGWAPAISLEDGIASTYAWYLENRFSPVRSTERTRIRDFVLNHASRTLCISDIRRALPGLGDGTIRLVLDGLRADGQTDVDGPDRGAAWPQL